MDKSRYFHNLLSFRLQRFHVAAFQLECMNRDTTIFLLCGLFLIAEVLAVRETILEIRVATLNELSISILAEAVFAAVVLLLFGAVLRKRYRRQKRPANRWRLEVVQPLRRLFVSVWS